MYRKKKERSKYRKKRSEKIKLKKKTQERHVKFSTKSRRKKIVHIKKKLPAIFEFVFFKDNFNSSNWASVIMGVPLL